MNNSLIFLPVIAQIALTLYVYVALLGAKKKAVKAGEVDEERRALYEDAWPESVQKINNNIRSQFEIPVLFYVLCVVLWASNGVSALSLAVASLFVLSRCCHLYVHTGSNLVPLRRNLFTIGVVMVIVLLVLCLVSIVSA
ncbi:MAG: MAPEG family protein [Pseudomonadales bacterium]